MQLKTISENSPVSSPKMVRTKRGKRKTDESEEIANETLETNDTSTVDEMKENELKNGANIDVSPKKLCNIKETKEPKLNGDQTFTPRRSRRRVSDASSVQSEQSVSVVVKNRKRSPPNIGSLTEEQSEIQPNGEAESHTETSNGGGGTKRKNSESGKTDAMSVADRIKLLSHDQNQKSTPPRTDSVLQLLLQGLNSKDKHILQSVLERVDEEIINDTVKRLPLEAILPLLETLHHYIQGKTPLVFSHGKWLKAVLQHHTSYIMSSPECEEILSSMNTIIEARTRSYSKILQLKGKLDMIVKQINTQDEDDRFQPELIQPSKEALLVYQDDSSDELNDKLDEMLLPASDTDNDDWDTNNDAVEADSDAEAEDVVEVLDEDDSDDNDNLEESDQEHVQVNGINDGHESSDMDADD
jgi:hypothetical protein